MNEWVKRWSKWFLQTCTIVGIPATIYLGVTTIKASALVAGCKIANVGCEQSRVAVDEAMSTIIAAYPDYDVTLKKVGK